MKEIDTRFPLFGQLEMGDTIYSFDSFSKDGNIFAYKVIMTKPNHINYCDDRQLDPFREITVDDFSSSVTYDSGIGFATSREAAYDAMSKFIGKEIENTNKKINELQLKINSLTADREKLKTRFCYLSDKTVSTEIFET